MVSFVEQTCRKLVEPFLAEGMTTVGTAVRVHHLAPTPMGGNISIRAEIVNIEKNEISFQAELWDEMEKVGEADHKRAVIEIERFASRVEKKSV